MAIKVNGISVVNDGRKGEFRSANPGRYTTVERDNLFPAIGDMIFNTDDSALQIWDGTEWGSAGGADETKAPVIFSASLTDENKTTDTRFTGEEFTTSITMSEEGVPVSTKGVKGVVTAEFDTYPATEASTDVTITETTGTREQVTIDGSAQITYKQYRMPSWVDVYDPSIDRTRLYMFQLNHDYPSYIYEFTNPANPADNYRAGSTSSNVQTSPSFWFENKYRDRINAWSNGDYSYSFETNQWLQSNFSHGTTPVYYFSGTSYEYKVSLNTTGNPVYVTLQKRPLNYDGDPNGGWQNMGTGTPFRYLQSVDSSSSANLFGFECLPNSVLIVAKSNSTGFFYKRIDEEWANQQNWDDTNGLLYLYGDYTNIVPKNSDRLGCCIHKGCMYLSVGGSGGITRWDPNSGVTAVNKPSLEGGATYDYPQVFTRPGDNTWLYCNVTDNTDTTRRYKSNNQGATWIPTGAPSSVTSNRSNVSYMQTHAWGGAEMNMEGSSYGSGYWQSYWQTLRYQDVVVTNGANLDQLNVGDVVVPSSFPRPNVNGQELTISAMTDNGNGTTTIRMLGFGDVVVGDTLESLNPTGSQIQDRYLVVDVLGNVTNTQAADPGFTDIGPGGDFTFKFPPTFPTGSTPDEELPEGTTIKAEVQATNVAATASTITNTLTPGLSTQVFGCSGFTINRSEGNQPEQFNWWNDAQEDISNTPAEFVDSLWKTLWPYDNKTIYQTQQGFFIWRQTSAQFSGREISFDFSGTNLANKILEIYVMCYKTSNMDYYSDIQAGFTGCTIYNNQSLTWNETGGGATTQVHRLLLDGSEDINFTIRTRTQDSAPQTTEYMAICAYRLTDINGNEIPCVYPDPNS